MDFGALPPEVNSAKMYSGPGAGPMLAAAAAWDSLAADLYSVASSIQSIISELTLGLWLGASSASMAAAAMRYVAWLNVTAAQAKQTDIQIATAAGAYETAFRMTVPPQDVEANRTLVRVLTETNIAGENAPLIADAEAAYDEMWDRDVTAMYGYANAAAAAVAATTPFEAPPEIVNETGLGQQAIGITMGMRNVLSMLSDNGGMVDSVLSMADTASSMLAGVLPAAPAAVEDTVLAVGDEAAALAQAVGGALGRAAGVVGVGGPELSAGLGRAMSVGSLSVPPSWDAANQAVAPAVRGLPVTGLGHAANSGPAPLMGGLPVGQLAHGAAGSGVSSALRTPPRAFVMPSTPAAG
ncbi:PPE family protein [Mycobacterium haemophilum DSM 44634]|uniref:PPE family domain-containing protein n=2 Tax=Mycobacterium haemophilum TaxID=29311 RepID=A0A0I9VFJ5_9MYCO|nr:hypothetical protein B586_07625 [Mycobacterium haemophilum DSM 44634]KLO30704.1 hypothetical protein ABH39_10025 [Mycobacterium haemophilum]KLO37747.1 hypothetical protein ABH38_07235 [Mycobacterium haemophilum]KLO43173.1 hypothetical protein ABH37_07850 [Mycobacterium haemophilum]KLO55569.1 hypothetical protein ABH36_06190 [Mycobacterium haemophilum]